MLMRITGWPGSAAHARGRQDKVAKTAIALRADLLEEFMPISTTPDMLFF
jgi:hypothetical protein